MMKFRYLGTAAAEGWPGLFCGCGACRKARMLGGKDIRSRSQAMIDDKVLLDFCQDTYYHMIVNGLDFTKVSDIFVTHSHSDHFYAPDLMMKGVPYAEDGVKQPVCLYGTGKVKGFYDRMLKEENDSPNLMDCMQFCEVVPFVSYQTGAYRVTPLLARHDPGEVCVFYAVEKEEQGVVCSLLYAHDTACFPEESYEWMKGKYFNLVSLDCTMGVLEDGSTHMGLDGCRKTKERLLLMNCADSRTVFVLNHFSHNQGAGLSYAKMEELVKEDGFLIAYDGMVVQVGKESGFESVEI